MERITGFMTPRTRQATVALADEGDEDRPVTGRVAITEAVAPRGTAGVPGGHQGMVKAQGATLGLLVPPWGERSAKRSQQLPFLMKRRR